MNHFEIEVALQNADIIGTAEEIIEDVVLALI